MQAPSHIAAGAKHAAAIVNGDLYTWGRTHSGRLGTGTLVLDTAVAPVSRIEHLQMLQIKVFSVACGEGTSSLRH